MVHGASNHQLQDHLQQAQLLQRDRATLPVISISPPLILWDGW